MNGNPLCAILLAAGSGRRFSGDKLTAPLEGKPLYQHTFDVVKACGFAQVVAVTNQQTIREHTAAYGFRAISNPQSHEGIAASVRCGVAAVPHAPAWMFFVCDQPFLTAATVKQLIDCHRQTGKAVVPRFAGTPGNPCVFPTFCRDSLLALSGDTGGKQVLRTLPPEQITFIDISCARQGQDIDTLEAYEKAMNLTI